ncbi:hypothetical protein [Caenibacillus caldisaponilyticus]|uniref:hypothetical protein n=1 Tax=Caenibacillus caldisaponilyticus TaxID=1674942 RepID=UPI0009886B74|nr:hypothetical protein [Caenibacillus caldisaponilyticus]
MSRFAKIYVAVFTAIWVGNGVFSLLVHRPGALNTLIYGVGFSVVFFMATVFSQWLFRRYKEVDKQSKKLLAKRP